MDGFGLTNRSHFKLHGTGPDIPSETSDFTRGSGFVRTAPQLLAREPIGPVVAQPHFHVSSTYHASGDKLAAAIRSARLG